MTPSDVFRGRMREVREHKGWRQQDLANALADLGHPISRPDIGKIESTKRGVSLDDALAIATALEVTPLHLFAPLKDRGHVEIGDRAVLSYMLRAYVRGERPLARMNQRFFYSEVPDSEYKTPEQHQQEYLEKLEAMGITVTTSRRKKGE